MAKLQQWSRQVGFVVSPAVLWMGLGAALFSQEMTPSQVFEKVKDSVLVVKAIDAQGKVRSQGSGVKLPSGRVVTNFHVVKNSAAFLVCQEGNCVPAQIKVADEEKDLCLLDAPTLNAPSVPLGRTSDLKVGAAVYAVGSPKGLELSLSNGLVSQLRGGKPPIIQTTASISPGSSGGGLFDDHGRLVGITSFYLEGGQNLNFALPVEWIQDLRVSSQLGQARSTGEWVAHGTKLEREERWAELLDLCKAWVDSNGTSSVAWYNLGTAFGHLNRRSEAIDAYRKALRISPEFPQAWQNLGAAYSDLKRYTEAVEAFRQGLGINSNNSEVWYNLGTAYLQLDRYSEATKSLRQALKIDPNLVKAWINLGIAFSRSKRYSDGIDAYRQAVKIDPANAEAWFSLGTIYNELHRYPLAIDAYNQALRINPDFADAWNNIGATYLLYGDKVGALDAVKQLQRLDPARADRLFNFIFPRPSN